MSKRILLMCLLVMLAAFLSLNGFALDTAQPVIKPTPLLHVEGNQLKDPAGNSILLHGWMQPTASWFNGQGKWYTDPWDWTRLESPLLHSGVSDFLGFMNEVATLMSDRSPRYGRDHGWHCSFVRVNTDTVGGWSSSEGLIDPDQFDAWIENFLVPYANHLQTHGLYLVLSATGPMVVNVDGDMSKNASEGTQSRLVTFWERIASAPGIKNADNIMFELMNEPVMIESAPGNNDWGMQNEVYFEAFTKWLQPIIDVIRNTGANNIIWVPTLEWQGSPHQWVDYTFAGENIGVAVHFYPTYGGVFDNARNLQNLWDRQYKPAADRWPMIITEMFWTPYPDDPWNLVNGSTDGFGNNIKKAIDNQGNVSYMIGFISDLLDDLNECRPADCDLSPREGAQAYFDWMPEYASQSIRSYGCRKIPGRIEAERYESMLGVRVESNTEDSASRHIGDIAPGAWTRYLVDVAKTGSYTMSFKVATGADTDNNIVIRNESGDILGILTVNSTRTDRWQDWYMDSVTIDLSEGEQTLILEFEGESEHLFSIDWFELKFTT